MYNSLRYADITTIPSYATQSIASFDTPTNSYEKVMTIDSLISVGYDHSNLIGRYISTYYVEASGIPTFLRTNTLFEHTQIDGGSLSYPKYIYSESVTGNKISIDIYGIGGVCIYDTKIEY